MDSSRNLVNIAAITATGNVTLTASGSANSATLQIDNPDSNTFNHSIEAFAANLTNGESNVILVGKEGSTRNSGYIGYYWTSAGSNNNFVSLGHWAADHLFRVYGDQVLSTVTFRSNVDVQSPIFYDKNDTTYYADFNNTGTSLKIAGGIQTNASNGNVIIKHTVSEANSWIFQENAANWGLFWVNEGGSSKAVTFGSYNTVGAEFVGFRQNSNTNMINPSVWTGIDSNAHAAWLLSNYSGDFWTAGTQYSAADMRAPIFYDSNNTGRYINPASSSRIDQLEIANTSNQENPGSRMKIGSDGFIFGGNNSGYETNSAQISAGYHTANSLNIVGMGTTSSVRRVDMWAENGFYVSGNIYDKDATSYYADFGGTSRTNSIISNIFSGDISTSGDGQNNYPFRLRYDYNAWMMTAASNTWGLFWAGNSGARYGTNGNGGPGNIWSNSTNPNEFVFVGGDTTLWTVHGTSGNTWQAGDGYAADSYRAPVFYDLDNTGYYVNPAGTSNINEIRSGESQAAPRWDTAFYVLQAQHWYGDTNTQTMYIGESGNVVNLRGDLRASIYRDFQNTAYYINAAATSVLNGLTVGGNTVEGFSGSWNAANMPGSRWNGFSVNGGEVVFQRDNPSTGRMSVMVDGQFYAGENGGFYSLPSNNDYNNRRGFYQDTAGNLQIGTSSTENTLKTTHGYIQLGPMNASHAHIYTDRSNFYFNKRIELLGGTLINQNDVQSVIYYDRSDTSKYCDPNGVSQFSGLTVANRISGSIDAVGITGYQSNSISFQQTSGSFAGRSGWHNHIISNHGNGSNYYNTIISMDFWGAVYHSRLEGGTFNGPYMFCSAAAGFTSSYEINSSLRMKASEFWDYNNTNYYAHLDSTGYSIRIAGTVQSNYSDIQLKDVIENIPNALDKVNQLNGFYYYPNEIAQGYGYKKKKEVGLSAQEVEAVLPESVPVYVKFTCVITSDKPSRVGAFFIAVIAHV